MPLQMVRGKKKKRRNVCLWAEHLGFSSSFPPSSTCSLLSHLLVAGEVHASPVIFSLPLSLSKEPQPGADQPLL